ncbi:hypothetical protein LJB81_00055 [Desulfovibrio sp. OttesenSCG-928-M14]|nr:hypothetical protein [Desulfovibrio sp. OttesenSCG-928-M14]
MRLRWCFTALCLLLMTASAAQAEGRADMRPLDEDVSVSIPAQWNAEQQGPDMWAISSPDEACQIQFMTRKYVFPDAAILARGRAADFEAEKTLRALPDGQGYVFSASGSRFWFVESGGWTLTIAVTGPHHDLADLLRSFSAKDSGLHAVFTTMGNTPAVLDWLTHSDGSLAEGAAIGSPLPPVKDPVMPDFTQYGAAQGEEGAPPSMAQKLPKGWSYRTIGSWAVATSENGGHWAAARAYSVANADRKLPEGAPLMETAKEVATRLGGRNLAPGGGVVYFDIPSGLAEVSCASGGKTLVSLYSDRRALEDLFGFAALPGAE